MSLESEAPALSAITVREALRLPVLRRGLPEVVAGHEHLDRPVRWVHAGEVSNIASLLTGGEMLLTTGMGIGRQQFAQRRFVNDLADRQVAALVIELGGAFTDLPHTLIEAAEGADLPLIALHQEIPFVAVTKAIHTELVSSHYALLRRGEEVHRQLSGLMLDGQGIPDVLAALAELLSAPVYLEAHGALLSYAKPPVYELDPLEVWEAARESVDGVTVRAAQVRIGGDHSGGRLLVADLQSGDEAVAQIALGHAADLLALALLRERHEEELLIRERGTFLANLADGRIGPSAAARAAQAAGLERSPEVLLPLSAAVRAERILVAADWEAALSEGRRRLHERGLDCVLGRRETGTSVLGLVALRKAHQRANASDIVAAELRRTHGRWLGAEAITIVIGRASPPEAAGSELRLTEESAASAVGLDERAWHDVAALELPRLLWTRRDDADLAGFVHRTLHLLLDHDRRRKRELLPTLEAYLDHGGHKAATARALHLNRQALYDRLKRVEELLGVDLRDAQQRATLHVALYARHYVTGLSD